MAEPREITPGANVRGGWAAARDTAFVLLVALPWLAPWAPGPSPNVVPLLLSWAASAWLLCASPGLPQAAGRLGLAVLAGALPLLLLQAGAVQIGTYAAICACAACAVAARADGGTRAAQRIASGWAIAALGSSVVALLQYFGAAGPLHPAVAAADLGEAYGNLRQRNQFATLSSLGLLSVLWLGRNWRWPFMLACICLLAAANAASASRIGLLQWIVVTLAVGCWGGADRRRWLACSAAALAAYVTAAVVLPALLQWVTGQKGLNVFSRILAEASCGTRSVLWPNVIELIAQRPWTGWGWGELDYAHYVHLYGAQRFCDILDNAHNLPLHLAVELGIPAAVVACGVALWAVARYRPWAETDASRRIAWLAIAAVLLHSMVEYPLWYGPFQMTFGFALGLLWRRGRSAHAGPPMALRTGFAILASAALAYVAWDYHRTSQLYVAPEQRSAAYAEDTLGKARASWLFRDQVRFAELSITPLTRENAPGMLAQASDLLHFSPEPKVIQTLLEAALVLGRDDLLAFHLPRFRAAFPEQYEAWMRERTAQPVAR